MGVRGAGLELTNCGPEAIIVNGYPYVAPLGVPGYDVEVHEGNEGGSAPSFASDEDPGPIEIIVEPGEVVTSLMLWRQLVEDGTSIEVNELDIAVSEGEPAQTIEPNSPIDLGTTRAIRVSAWRS